MRSRFLVSFIFCFSLFFHQKAMSGESDWTFLVFINGNNNLDTYGKADINEMEKVGSTDRVNVVVQWASYQRRTTQRMRIEKDPANSVQVISPVLQEMPRVDMGDWRNLLEFVQWGVTRFPAKKYFVAVWNHGSGWRLSQKALSQGIGVMDISHDDFSGNAITTVELGRVLDSVAKSLGRKIDIYGSDACLMGMAEVASQMEESVHYFVGSQDLEPGDGWPYDQFLAKWNEVHHATPEQVSKILVDEFLKSYQNGSQGRSEVTLSAYHLDQMSTFYQAVSELGNEILNLDPMQKKEMIQAIKKTFNFAYSDYGDFGNFLEQLQKSKNLSIRRAYLDQAKRALNQLVIANRTTQEFAPATGVAVWLPWSGGVFENYRDRYVELSFHKKTGWGNVLNGILSP